MPDIAETWKKIDFLANEMVESATKGQTRLATPFEAKNFWPQDVDAAGLLAWKRLTAKGEPVPESIDRINAIWDNLIDEYVKQNPYAVSTAPTALERFQQQPLKMTRRAIATSFGMQKWAREHTDRRARLYASMAASGATGNTFRAFLPREDGK